MLPKGKPHPENHLGYAKDPHTIRLFNEPHPDPTSALWAEYPQPRMSLRSQELYQPVPNREYRKSLYESPLPHSALLLLFLSCIISLLILLYSQYSKPVRRRQADSATEVSDTRVGAV